MTRGTLPAPLRHGGTFSSRSGLHKQEPPKQGSPKAALASIVCGARRPKAVSPFSRAANTSRAQASFRLFSPARPYSTLS